MKLVYAIVRNDNEDDVVSLLNQNHYSVTRLSTTGGFLKKGNTTLMIGVEDEKVEEVIALIKQECGQHQKLYCKYALYLWYCHGELCHHAYDRRSRRRYHFCDQCRPLRENIRRQQGQSTKTRSGAHPKGGKGPGFFLSAAGKRQVQVLKKVQDICP